MRPRRSIEATRSRRDLPRRVGLAIGCLLLAGGGVWPDAARAEETEGAGSERRAGLGEAQAGEAVTWYAASIASGRAGALVTHHWSKGSRLRSESVLGGHRIVTIVAGPYYYILDPVAGRGLRIGRSPNATTADSGSRRPFATEWNYAKSQGAEIIRTETLGGESVDVFQHSNMRGQTRVWMTQAEPRLPYRVEAYDRRSGSNSVIDYSGWSRGFPISDRFFEPEGNLEMSEMTYEEFSGADPDRLRRAPILYPELLHGLRAP